MLPHKLKECVENLSLDLRGKVVLTEAASGHYVVTPVLAALAGAKVYAYSRTTRYGTVEEVFDTTRKWMQACGVDAHLITEITPEIIAEADVITNSGHLRPLTPDMLQHAKDSVVIPLMYEAWEWRGADMDIDYIRSRGIKIAATNERHPDVDVFNYLGDMAMQQIFDAGTCPYRNKFVLVCNNDFGPYIAKVIARNCAGLAVIDTEENRSRYDMDNITWVGGFPDINIPEEFKSADGIIFTAYPFDQTWIGNNTPISAQQIKDQFYNPLILRFDGHVDTAVLREKGIRYFPEHVEPGHMGVLPSAIGLDPTIRLQAGGLKVAEAMMKGDFMYKNIHVGEWL